MIETRFDATARQVSVILRPNQPWTWRANVWLLAALTTISLTTAIAFAWVGLWLVLPYSVLEVSVVSFCLWLCVHRGYRQQVIVLAPETVLLQSGQRSTPPRLSVDRVFNRFFARFHVERGRHPWREPSVHLRCQDERFEIGAFLSREERESLPGLLRSGIRYVESRGDQ
ncbi:MAG: DUF2244 domain-containing protein [Pseudomonadales bacterium]|nr:DUF2244 domain-containing protein [Pseudomonadales bacterium]MCP5184862.1 DUF2244 domain-containing protein [Pseudomonadales bacterium]